MRHTPSWSVWYAQLKSVFPSFCQEFMVVTEIFYPSAIFIKTPTMTWSCILVACNVIVVRIYKTLLDSSMVKIIIIFANTNLTWKPNLLYLFIRRQFFCDNIFWIIELTHQLSCSWLGSSWVLVLPIMRAILFMKPPFSWMMVFTTWTRTPSFVMQVGLTAAVFSSFIGPLILSWRSCTFVWFTTFIPKSDVFLGD